MTEMYTTNIVGNKQSENYAGWMQEKQSVNIHDQVKHTHEWNEKILFQIIIFMHYYIWLVFYY